MGSTLSNRVLCIGETDWRGGCRGPGLTNAPSGARVHVKHAQALQQAAWQPPRRLVCRKIVDFTVR